jgi:hypothetical protein
MNCRKAYFYDSKSQAQMKTHYNTYVIIPVISFLMMNGCCESDNSKPEAKGNKTEVPHISYIAMNEVQPEEIDTAVIWFDDFSEERGYLESTGAIDYTENFGISGGSMKAGFRKGEINGEGNRKIAFGDFPQGANIVRKGRHFDEIYWRIYVKHEYGWEGTPAKMSRATSIVSENWQQAMIAHVWSGDGNSLTLDPARGVTGQSDTISTRHYNDFDHLFWLGNKPGSKFQISSTGESGYWVLVEASAKLNTPGKNDGNCRLWINGNPEAERINLNFRGSYTKHGINAVFLESYWNEGAIKTEGRWYDNFVVSTRPIGPVTCPLNPTLYKTPYHGSGTITAWEVEIAADNAGTDIVFRSGNTSDAEKITINSSSGIFEGSLKGTTHLLEGPVYYCRVRQKNSDGLWSPWSPWHQPFRVSGSQG